MKLGAEIRKEPGDATITARGERGASLAHQACLNRKQSGRDGGHAPMGSSDAEVEAAANGCLQLVIRRKQVHAPQIRVLHLQLSSMTSNLVPAGADGTAAMLPGPSSPNTAD